MTNVIFQFIQRNYYRDIYILFNILRYKNMSDKPTTLLDSKVLENHGEVDKTSGRYDKLFEEEGLN